jgi:adenosylmethionine-8-amino-7-oxononanoate aminotransferase
VPLGVIERAREAGVLTRGLVGHALQISPPFVLTEADVDFLVDAPSSSISA